jgi:O-succinylbenzoic acid--CoA ligase
MIAEWGKNHWLIEAAHTRPNSIAVMLEDRSLTLRELHKEVLTAAEFLSRNEIVKDENVGILVRHSYSFFVIVNALWVLGAVPVPLNTKLTSNELCEQTAKADISHVVTDEYNSHCVSGSEQTAAIIYSARMTGGQYSKPLVPVKPENTALIMFTSGSSGKPKAVVHTFKSIYESAKLTDSISNFQPNDVILASLPLYHIGGFMMPVRALLAGCAAAYPESLQFEDLCESLASVNPSVISLVPTILMRLLDENVKPGSKLRMAYTGGGPASDSLILKGFNSGWPIVKVYGSTETCSMATALLPEELHIKISSAGKPFVNVECIMYNEELCIKSPSLFKEYYKDTVETLEKIVNGFYHTGDFGRVEEGYIYIESRRSDIIVTGGENVSAKEVETLIRQIEGVEDVHIFPMSDEKWGQIVCAAVQVNPNAEVGSALIKEFLEEKLTRYKLPKKYFFLNKLPRNEMGKINLPQLLDMLMLP